MKIYLGSDHAGFKVKEKVRKILESLKIKYVDISSEYLPKDDFPDYAICVAEKVAKGRDRGILVCGSGIGMSIAANKVPGIRATRCTNKKEAKHSRSHNNSNILTLSDWQKHSEIKEIIKIWLETKFEGGRHKRRLDKIKKIENKYSK